MSLNYLLIDFNSYFASVEQQHDKLNTRFGKNTIYLAGAHRALGSAPMRIAFTHIPDLETEDDE